MITEPSPKKFRTSWMKLVATLLSTPGLHRSWKSRAQRKSLILSIFFWSRPIRKAFNGSTSFVPFTAVGVIWIEAVTSFGLKNDAFFSMLHKELKNGLKQATNHIFSFWLTCASMSPVERPEIAKISADRRSRVIVGYFILS